MLWGTFRLGLLGLAAVPELGKVAALPCPGRDGHGRSFTPGPALAGEDAAVSTWQRAAPVGPSCSGSTQPQAFRHPAGTGGRASLPPLVRKAVPPEQQPWEDPDGPPCGMWRGCWGAPLLTRGRRASIVPQGLLWSGPLRVRAFTWPRRRLHCVPAGISWGGGLHGEGGRGAGGASRAPGPWPARATGTTGPPVTTATEPAASGKGMWEGMGDPHEGTQDPAGAVLVGTLNGVKQWWGAISCSRFSKPHGPTWLLWPGAVRRTGQASPVLPVSYPPPFDIFSSSGVLSCPLWKDCMNIHHLKCSLVFSSVMSFKMKKTHM